MKHGGKRRSLYGKLIVTALLLLLVAIVIAEWYHVYRNVFLRAAYPQKYTELVEKNAAECKIDKNLVFAVIRTESSFNPNAQSKIGALGLMQLTPPTLEWAVNKTQQKENYTAQDLYKPDVNIKYGTIVLAAFLNEFGNEETAVAAYNAGRTNVKKWLSDSRYSKDGVTLSYIPFAETRDYVKKVEQSKKIYAYLYNSSSSE